MNNNRNKASDKNTNITRKIFSEVTLYGDKNQFKQMMENLPTHQLHAYLKKRPEIVVKSIYDSMKLLGGVALLPITALMVSGGYYLERRDGSLGMSALANACHVEDYSTEFIRILTQNIGRSNVPELIKQLDPFVMAKLSTNIWGGFAVLTRDAILTDIRQREPQLPKVYANYNCINHTEYMMEDNPAYVINFIEKNFIDLKKPIPLSEEGKKDSKKAKRYEDELKLYEKKEKWLCKTAAIAMQNPEKNKKILDAILKTEIFNLEIKRVFDRYGYAEFFNTNTLDPKSSLQFADLLMNRGDLFKSLSETQRETKAILLYLNAALNSKLEANTVSLLNARTAEAVNPNADLDDSSDINIKNLHKKLELQYGILLNEFLKEAQVPTKDSNLSEQGKVSLKALKSAVEENIKSQRVEIPKISKLIDSYMKETRNRESPHFSILEDLKLAGSTLKRISTKRLEKELDDLKPKEKENAYHPKHKRSPAFFSQPYGNAYGNRRPQSEKAIEIRKEAQKMLRESMGEGEGKTPPSTIGPKK